MLIVSNKNPPHSEALPAASPADFEQALAELESIVQRLEQGQQPLAEALADFERGVRLARVCEHSLQVAEQNVEQLLQGQDGAALAPFKTDPSGS